MWKIHFMSLWMELNCLDFFQYWGYLAFGILMLYRWNKEALVGKSSFVYNSNELAKASALPNIVSLSDHIVLLQG